MSSSMEVDMPSSSATVPASGAEKTVDVHPLAIVHMSDQYTRITCGGSPLPIDAPVVGLMFGMSGQQVDDETKGDSSSKKKKLEIRDAEDIPTELAENTAQQVSLHQAVFPQHSVVGWYRVACCGTDDDDTAAAAAAAETTKEGRSKPTATPPATVLTPTEQDLRLTQELQQHYAGANSNRPFVFALLQVPTSDGATTTTTTTDQLPLSIYEVRTVETDHSSAAAGGGSSVLVALEQWQLETSEPERIAVERVVRERPQELVVGQQESSSPNSAFATHLASVEKSFEAMHERLKILMDYLIRTERGEIPLNPQLLREVQGLVYQLGPLLFQHDAAQQSQNTNDQQQKQKQQEDAAWLSQLAAVAKTVSAVQGYTEKFRTLYEHRPMTGRDPRGRHWSS